MSQTSSVQQKAQTVWTDTGMTPFGCVMRLMGKDFLQLKSPRDKETFWQTARQDSSLDSMF